ncbi:bile acid:sodium symporter family protein [Serpentinicella sp. ANB-PHB4]|uniref:bile acid:sodium symporter family protein n=1 Tax=Serpentinicella sp. ANB-PHB4 TaxID=3074076 RepID=UPI00285DC306|nr:bile acid:sodium symporter family protein [Serpentinicella sp. ANB-PHB4]MDR5658396.1 bile acid:sodium symporter family protein [Serpentinicella sp. ANB-PHB4]
MKFLEKLSRIAGNYFSVWIILVSVLGLLNPSIFAWSLPHIPLFLGVIMFGMGMTLKGDDFKRVLLQPKAILVGVFAQFIGMSLIAFLIAKTFNLDPELAIGVILLGACPGGTASNVITYLARGNVPVSVTMTSISTILAPFLTPLIMLVFAGQWLPVSASVLFVDILKIVLIPVIMGMATRKLLNNSIEKSLKILPLVSVVAILIIVGAIIGANAERIFTSGILVFIVVILHNLMGLLIGYTIGKFFKIDEDKIRAITLEVGMQNSGLAVSLANVHFGPLAALPGALFSVWHNISGTALATYWNRKDSKKNAPHIHIGKS